MTHAYLSADISSAPPLPAEFFERSAYMRLYSAYQHSDAFWPAHVFGAEIDVLLIRDHAETHGSGYRLTKAGVGHWEAYVKQWGASTPIAHSRKGVQPFWVRLLLTVQDGTWHGLTALALGYSRSHTFDVCERLYRDGYVAKRRRECDHAWEFQITDAGCVRARELEGEKAS